MNTFEQMTDRGHERVCFHQDPETGLRAIVAIHSTKLGNALGGTRRWHYATEADALYDVLRLSEGMTYKAACAGLTMGGGKSVILLRSPGEESTEGAARAMGRFVDTFSGAYIAAEDVGVDPQFIDWMAMETRHVMGGEKISRGGDPSPFTAEGTINAMKACLAHLGRPVDFSGLRVAVQGVGAVGYHIVSLLASAGAKLIVSDVKESALERTARDFDVEVVAPDEIVTTRCDILAPCALGGVIDSNLARRLQCKVVCGAANNILDDPDEDSAMLRSLDIVYAPDFVANAGGLIHLAGLYLEMTDEQLDDKITEIEKTTTEILQQGETYSSTHAAAVAVANRRITEGSNQQVHAG
jgi:leucine dehydrogenase